MSFLLEKTSWQKGVSQFLINRFLICETLLYGVFFVVGADTAQSSSSSGYLLVIFVTGRTILYANEKKNLVGRQGLGGLRPKRCYCGWVPIYVTGYLAGYISRRRVTTSFSQCLVLPPLQLPCQKDQPGHRCFDS